MANAGEPECEEPIDDLTCIRRAARRLRRIRTEILRNPDAPRLRARAKVRDLLIERLRLLEELYVGVVPHPCCSCGPSLPSTPVTNLWKCIDICGACLEEAEQSLSHVEARLAGRTDEPFIAPDLLAARLAVLAGLMERQNAADQKSFAIFEESRSGIVTLLRKRGAVRSHSIDFRSVKWYGSSYTFTSTQARAVQTLWEAYERGAPAVGNEALQEAVGSCAGSFRLRDIFKTKEGVHPAFREMIQPAGKGSYMLAIPSPQENPPSTQ